MEPLLRSPISNRLVRATLRNTHEIALKCGRNLPSEWQEMVREYMYRGHALIGMNVKHNYLFQYSLYESSNNLQVYVRTPFAKQNMYIVIGKPKSIGKYMNTMNLPDADRVLFLTTK